MSDNIHVAVRMRPLIPREISEKAAIHWNAMQATTVCQSNMPSVKFNFDRVFQGHESNEDVYSEFCSPIVQSVIDGFNGTIFAYGQTSSGKTFTMMGDDDGKTLGIIHLTISDIFQFIQNMPNREFLLRVSYMEIYNEKVRDLLSDQLNENENLKVKEDKYGQIKVLHLSEHIVQEPEQVLQLMRKAEGKRKTGETRMNKRSSRSHSIFRMIIESGLRGAEDAAVNVSQFNLVDLAGSERATQTGAKGDRFNESRHINLSLLMLSQVISQLSEKQDQFINYRDSNLTRILQNSLGGNARTAIICTITPATLDETLSTLKFATRAKCIKNKPQVNEVLTEQALLKRYANEIKKLTAELEATKEEKAQQNKNLQSQIQNLQQKFVFQVSPERNKSRATRRETWGGCLDAARLKQLIGSSKPLISKDFPIFEEEIPAMRKSSGQLFLSSFEEDFSVNRTSRSQTLSSVLPTLEEECENDINLTELEDPFLSHSSKYFSKQSMPTALKVDAVVQTDVESQRSPSSVFSESDRKELTERILSLEEERNELRKELKDLKEFTTLERQMMSSQNCTPEIHVCNDSGFSRQMTEITSSEKEDTLNASKLKYEAEYSLGDSLEKLCSEDEFRQKNVKSNEDTFTPLSQVQLSTDVMNTVKEDFYDYLEDTIKILSKQKNINLDSCASAATGLHKIIMHMFNLVLQHQCSTFKGSFKSDLSNKINGIADDLASILCQFSDKSNPKVETEELIDNFIDKTDSVLKEIDMFSLDVEYEKNSLANQSMRFEGSYEVPSFEKSYACDNSVFLFGSDNLVPKDLHKTVNLSHISESADSPEVKKLVPQITFTQADSVAESFPLHIDEVGGNQYLSSSTCNIHSCNKTETNLKDASVQVNEIPVESSASQDKNDSFIQSFHKFSQTEKESVHSILDQSTQTTADEKEESSLQILNQSTQTTTDLEEKLAIPNSHKFTQTTADEKQEFPLQIFGESTPTNSEDKLGIQNCHEFAQTTAHMGDKSIIHKFTQTTTDVDPSGGNLVLEETYGDLYELKMFGLEFLQKEIKGYLREVDKIGCAEGSPLPIKIKVEVTAIKELLQSLIFYITDRAESVSYFNTQYVEKMLEIDLLQQQLDQSRKNDEKSLVELEHLGNSFLDLQNMVFALFRKAFCSIEQDSSCLEWAESSSMSLSNTLSSRLMHLQKMILELGSCIAKNSPAIEDLSMKLKEEENKLSVMQENVLKSTKSVQTLEDHRLLDITRRLEETEDSKEATENELSILKIKMNFLNKDKEDLETELNDKVLHYNKKIVDLEAKHEEDWGNWTNETRKLVNEAGEGYKQMMNEKEKEKEELVNELRKELDDKNNLKHKLNEVENDITSYQKEITDLESKVQEQMKEICTGNEKERLYKGKLTEYMCKLEKYALERQRLKEKLKENRSVKDGETQTNSMERQEKQSERGLRKAVGDEGGQTNIFQLPQNHTADPIFCDKCMVLTNKISDREVITKRIEGDCKNLKDEILVKKEKITSLQMSNDNLVKKVGLLEKDLSSKMVLLRSCHCRMNSQPTDVQHLETPMGKSKDSHDKNSKLSERIDVISSEILESEIVQKAILKARAEERAVLNSGSGPDNMMKCFVLQQKLNKMSKEMESLKKQHAELKAYPPKRHATGQSEDHVVKNPTGFAEKEDLTVYTKSVHPYPVGAVPKVAKKKILQDRNQGSQNPINQHVQKQNTVDAVPNITPVTKSNKLPLQKNGGNTENEDKVKRTLREIEAFSSGEPECKQQ